VGKRQTRLAGLDDRILGLYAGGLSVRDIEAHLSDLYVVSGLGRRGKRSAGVGQPYGSRDAQP
jgi:hypothetical protein